MKQLFKKTAIASASAVVLGISALGASAATLTFDTWQTTSDNLVIDTAPTVTVDDAATADALTFTVSLPNANGELSGIWLDFFSAFSFAESSITILTSGISLERFESPADSDLGNGINLNGTTSANSFYLGFGFNDGESGGAGRQVGLPLSFALDDQGGSIELADLSRIGLRFQSVGTLGQDGLGEGSEKLVGLNPVPLPAAGWLLMMALGGLGVASRRHRKAQQS